MKTKIFALVALFLYSLTAHAEWTKLTEQGDRVMYMDVKATRRQGDIVKVWLLLDYKTPQQSETKGEAYRSARMQMHINCRDETSSIAHFSNHSDLQATGRSIGSHTYSVQKWEPIAPNTAMYDITEIACKYTK